MSEARAEQLERDIMRTREDVDRVLSALEQKLSPGQIFEDIMHRAGSGPKDFAVKLAGQIRENPLPATLTAVGLAWLAASTRGDGEAKLSEDERSALQQYRRLQRLEDSPYRTPDEDDAAYESRIYYTRAAILDVDQDASESSEDFRRRVDQQHKSLRDRVSSLMSKVERSAGRIKHKFEDAAHGVKDAAASIKERTSDWAHKGKDQAAHMKHGTQDMMRMARDLHETNPMITGAVMFAIGAAVGAMTPNTEAEDRLMADAKQKLKDEAGERAHALKEEAKSIAKDAAQQASDRMRQAGGGANGSTAST